MTDSATDSSRTVLVAGTASHVGKSTVVTGLCRHLAGRGFAVVPYKAQNMSNNARAVPIPESAGSGFGEIGVSQYVQARAARIQPTTDVNPVLLKPRGEGESQLVIDGEAVGHYEAERYYDEYWKTACEAAEEAYHRLSAEYDILVAEGAGSIAELNLHHRDLANVETARFSDATILLVADIERGGVFAALYGTLSLMPADLGERVVGAVITKFRGERSLLEPGIEAFEERTGVPILGVIPYSDPELPAEDSVSLPSTGERAVFGEDDGVPPARSVQIAVPRLPRISNFTDLEPLAREPGVRVVYVPLDDSLDSADAVVLPGTKNTVDDLLALRDAGFNTELEEFDGPVVGLCGGYQLLGERITNADVESTHDMATVRGLGLLPVETQFSPSKTVEAVTHELHGVGPLAGASGAVSGYEIHMGETTACAPVDQPLPKRGVRGGAAIGRVFGTYLHGLFENTAACEAFLDAVFAAAGRTRPKQADDRGSAYDRAATLIEEHIHLGPLDFEFS
jgi:adenosylcobyric acid synthase